MLEVESAASEIERVKMHLRKTLLKIVGSVVEWLKRWARNQHCLGSKPTRAILLYPWERHFTALSPAWWSWQAVLNYKQIAISWHLQKQVGVIACPMYSASVAFLRVRRINIEIK